MLKKILPLVMVITLLTGLGVHGEAGVTIEPYRIEKESAGDIDIVIPRLKGLETRELRKEVNDITRTLVEEEIKKFNEGLFDKEAYFKVDYEVKAEKDIISIIIRKDQVRDGMEVPILNQYINIDIVNNRLLNLGDIFRDKSALESVGQLVKAKDKKLILKGIEDFYLEEDGGLTIIFNNSRDNNKEIVEVSFTGEEIREYLIDEALMGLVFFKEEINLGLEGDISVMLPRIKGLKDKGLEEELNKKIGSQVELEVEKFKREISSGKNDLEFKVNYRHSENKGIVSIELNVYKYIEGVNTGETVKYFYNIDTRNNRILDLSDLFVDRGYIEKINTIIKARILENPKNFYNDNKKFKSIGENQKFYLDKYGNLVICFDQYEIGDKAAGLPEFRISFYDIRNNVRNEFENFGISKLDRIIVNNKPLKLRQPMYISKNGNLMLAIDDLVKELGIDLAYDEKENIYMLETEDIRSSFSIKENLYSLNDAKVFLEEEAKLKDGLVYLPEKYLDQVLKLEVFIKDGQLNISNQKNLKS